MVVIIYGHNEFEHMQQCVKCVQENIDDSDFIIAVDNGSTDGTFDWLKEQENLDAACFDDGEHTFANMTNEIFKAYGFDEDILFIEARHLPTKNSIQKLKRLCLRILTLEQLRRS